MLIAELGVLGGDHDVAGLGELKTPGKGKAVNGSDGRSAAALQERENMVPALQEVAERLGTREVLLDVTQVGPGAEHSAGPAHDDDARLGVTLDDVKRVL